LGFIDASALDSCTPFTGFGAATCGGVSYNDNSGGQNQLGIQSNITGGGPVSFYYYFASGDFGSVGTFTAASNGNTGTLTVSGAPAAVPELATWAMMLLGFTGIGMAMRRQRAPTLAQVA
jgi:hypothetical protein